MAEEFVIGEKEHRKYRCAVGTQGHESGVRTGKFSHISVNHVQAQGKHNGDQSQFERQNPVSTDIRPYIQGRIRECDMDENRNEHRIIQKFCGHPVCRYGTQACHDTDGQNIYQQHVDHGTWGSTTAS